jgi:hypothetical protein
MVDAEEVDWPYLRLNGKRRGWFIVGSPVRSDQAKNQKLGKIEPGSSCVVITFGKVASGKETQKSINPDARLGMLGTPSARRWNQRCPYPSRSTMKRITRGRKSMIPMFAFSEKGSCVNLIYGDSVVCVLF